MRFSDEFLKELMDRNDIEEVVSEYVNLGRTSGSNRFGLCPFHSEKTPSFSVNRDKQIFYCFGCHKGGDVINFIMSIENLSFPEAVEFLAKRVNMEMPADSGDKEDGRRKRMAALNRAAALYFYKFLCRDPSGPAAGYMEKRKIRPETAVHFGLGYAPDSWDGLRNAMREKGFHDSEMYAAGLVRKGKNGSYYDTFRGRLMFPVIDVRGTVIGFSGRVLGDGEPKYMNSPETLLYNKRKNLYALNFARQSKKGYILLCEGNVDVVSLHQAGFDSAVATLGTALTPEQARLLSRYTSEIVLAYDNDGAGIRASQRAIGILEQLQVQVRVLQLQGAKDPDEYIQKFGAASFENRIHASEDQMDYQLQRLLDRCDLRQDDQKIAFVRQAASLVASQPGAVEREVYAMRVASLTGIKQEIIMKAVEQTRRRKENGLRRQKEKETHPARAIQPRNRDLQYTDPRSAAAEEGLIRLLSLDAALEKEAEFPAPEEFSSPVLQHIYTILLEEARDSDQTGSGVRSALLSPDEMEILAGILQKPGSLQNARQAVADYTRVIREQKKIREGTDDLRALAQEMKDKKGYQP